MAMRQLYRIAHGLIKNWKTLDQITENTIRQETQQSGKEFEHIAPKIIKNAI